MLERRRYNVGELLITYIVHSNRLEKIAAENDRETAETAAVRTLVA